MVRTTSSAKGQSEPLLPIAEPQARQAATPDPGPYGTILGRGKNDAHCGEGERVIVSGYGGEQKALL